MGRKPKDVTDAELAILRVLWEQGRATIRQVADVLYPGGSASEYATVKKLLARLERKGCVSRDDRDVAHVFQAKISHDDLLARRLRALSDDLCGGSRVPLLMNLMRAQKLTRQERRELDRLLDELIRSRRKRT